MSKLQEAKDLLAATEGHTPGPWSILEQPMGEIFDVARCLGEHVAKWVAMEVRGEDAHIIAQAPALRELLAAMVAEVEDLNLTLEAWVENSETHRKHVYELEAIIAEGREYEGSDCEPRCYGCRRLLDTCECPWGEAALNHRTRGHAVENVVPQ